VNPEAVRKILSKAYDTCVYTKEEVQRITKLGFEYAAKRINDSLLLIKQTYWLLRRLWRETVQEMIPDYPEIEVDFMFVDNAAMQIIQWPKKFDVMVTENMFGDILSDEASVITGSLGLLPSASVGIHTSVFEPIHGSYPQAAGKDIANPIATVLVGGYVAGSSAQFERRGQSHQRCCEHVDGSRNCN
jgi:3-isopropylmalate dehydrogenase